MKTVIIGQSQSGKSALLAGLHLASLHEGFSGRPWWKNAVEVLSDRNGSRAEKRLNGFEVQSRNFNEPFQRLSGEFAKIFENGFFGEAATNEVVIHQLDLHVRRPWIPWDVVGQKRVPSWCGMRTTVEMPDGPGEALFGEPSMLDASRRAHRNELVEHLKAADGVILCLPPPAKDGPRNASEEEKKRMFFRFFQGLLAEISKSEKGLPWRNFAIALTKADQLFYSRGRLALEEVRQNTSVDQLMGWLSEGSFTEPLIRQLQVATGNRVRIAAGWCSIYGFTREGLANFDPTTLKLLISPPEYRARDVEANWRPFQLLDPFLFAATGRTLSKVGDGNPGFLQIV